MTYREKLRDPRWAKKRAEIIERDDFKCRDCHATETEQPLQVHHCFYGKGEPWETDDDFLVTLCADCHEARTFQEGDAKRDLGVIFSRAPAFVRERVCALIRHARIEEVGA